MSDAIEAMKEAFAALSEGRVVAAQRTQLPVARNAGVSLIMPAFVDDGETDKQVLTVKVVSLFDNNKARGFARVQAAVLVLEPDTGRPSALLEGATLTAIRTAAASGAATDLLARPDSTNLAILGTGVQARVHLEAMCAVRPIKTAWICGTAPAKAEAFVDEMSARDEITADLHVAGSASEAISEADIVCAATTSRTPVFQDRDLKPGVHINAVGSYTPQAREVPAETVVRSHVVVDSREAAWQEAGDLIQPFEAGLIGRDHIHAELGELVRGLRPGRAGEEQITVFKSVGVAVQDAFAARVAVVNAQRLGRGREVHW